MSLSQKKILIVGGGPAGLMTALSLSKHNAEITLIDKSSWPIDKVCGEGIMPSGVKILKKYGADKYLNFREFSGISYIDNKFAKGIFMSGPGWLIRRKELSASLYDAVKQNTNVKMLAETQLDDWQHSNSQVSVQVSNCSNKSKTNLGQFDLMIACDGLRSSIRKKAGLEQLIGRQQSRMGARVHYQISPWTKQVEVYWGNGIECYVAPTSDSCVEFVFGWNQKKLKLKSGKGSILEDQLFTYFPDLLSKISNSPRLSDLEAMGSFGRKSVSPISGPIVLIGDALAFLDPITGEGMSLAFEQADILSRCFTEIFSEKGRKQYCNEIKKITSRYILMTKLALTLSDFPIFRRAIIYILNLFPKLFSHLLEVNMGHRKLLQLSSMHEQRVSL